MYSLGVDLGTVYTAAATWRNGHAEVVSLGSRLAAVPSVVLLREDDSFLVGEAAHRRALIEPSRVAREFKRRFGDATPIILGGTPHSPEALMGRLLRSVVAEVITREGEPPATLCVCHPASWGLYRIELLQQAVRMADLTMPVTLAVEPVAAAAHYAHRQRVDVGSLVAVYDLGGGTFDAAVVRRQADGSFEIVGRPEGIDHLGGADFDAAIFAHVRGVVGEPLESLDDDATDTAAVAVARLREECTSAKESLSSDTDASIPVLLPGCSTEVRITRFEFERMVGASLHDTIAALQRAIASAGATSADLHSVLLIGGSSRIPLVAQLVGFELDRPVAVDAHPKYAVALGAAWIAAHRTMAEPVAEPVAEVLPEATPPPVPEPAPEPVPAGTVTLPRPSVVPVPETVPVTRPPRPAPAPVLEEAALPPSGEDGELQTLRSTEAGGRSTRFRRGWSRRAVLTAVVAAAAVVLATAGILVTNARRNAQLYECPTSEPRWGCLERVTVDSGTLTFGIRSNIVATRSAIPDANHFHVYLANPARNGMTSPLETTIQNPRTEETWYELYYNATATTLDQVPRAGRGLWLDVGKYSLLCVRVVDVAHHLVRDHRGGHRTGNCVELSSSVRAAGPEHARVGGRSA